MTPYDVAMIGVVVAGMVWGAWRGITWQVASLASLALGYAVGMPLSGQLAGYFPGEPIVARALAWLVVYVGVSGGIYLVAWSIRAILRQWKFEAYDRHLGMLLGGAEGALLGLVVTVFVVSLAPGTRQSILTSTAGKVVGQIFVAASPALPEEVRMVLVPLEAAPGAEDAPPTAAAVADASQTQVERTGNDDGGSVKRR
jgi:membrane protein required for colicin V production